MTVKTYLYGLALAALFVVPAQAAITVPGANGSDGALSVTSNITIDLSQASPGAWDSNSPVPGRGVYDADKWAVVFHYSSVNITSGTVSFKNNASRAPVVWLVNGDVNISNTGAMDLRTEEGVGKQPGPGGFRTGHWNNGADVGFGPGGGAQSGVSGSYATLGGNTSSDLTYGSERIIPLIGGSGGYNAPGSGAILIAATGNITVNGAIHAEAFTGSGGSIRLIADSLLGNGTVYAYKRAGAGGDGRIEFETNATAASLVVLPVPVAGPPPNPVVLWPSAAASSTRIVSIGGITLSADPKASFNSAADAAPDISPGAPVDVIIETKNVATTSVVNLRVGPLSANASLTKATLVSGNASTATWKATIPAPAGTTVFQVRVEAQ
jgi:hypothetical protein